MLPLRDSVRSTVSRGQAASRTVLDERLWFRRCGLRHGEQKTVNELTAFSVVSSRFPSGSSSVPSRVQSRSVLSRLALLAVA